MIKWESAPGYNNIILCGEGFYISYNPNPHSGVAFFMSDYGGAETALQDEKSGTWYILNGDFRSEYEAVFSKGFHACLEVYMKYKDNHRSSWSTDSVGSDDVVDWIEKRSVDNKQLH